MTTKRTVSRARAGYQKANEEAATIIAGNPAAYPDGSLMSSWAGAVLTKAATPMDSECGPLFQQTNRRAA